MSLRIEGKRVALITSTLLTAAALQSCRSGPQPEPTRVVTFPTATILAPLRETVEISGGKAIVGRSKDTFINGVWVDGEITLAYKDCTSMVARTGQPSSICEPKNEVFGDSPRREIEISGFSIDKFEQHDGNGYPLQKTFKEAKASCNEQGGRLPTKDEWEVAARGKDGRIYPWGNEKPEPDFANIDTLGGNPNRPVKPVGSYPKGNTPEDLSDMIGNVGELVTEDDGLRDNGVAVEKGGNAGAYFIFGDPAHQIFPPSPESKAGFRCAYDSN